MPKTTERIASIYHVRGQDCLRLSAHCHGANSSKQKYLQKKRKESETTWRILAFVPRPSEAPTRTVGMVA